MGWDEAAPGTAHVRTWRGHPRFKGRVANEAEAATALFKTTS